MERSSNSYLLYYGNLLSISWSRFEDLKLANDESLPFDTKDATIRWKTNGLAEINPIIGQQIKGVMLGRGQLTFESREIEIWTRLVFDLGDQWFEMFDALDENGYKLHTAKPDGEFRTCI